ncbi:MAG: twin-arginine translocase TatA/TatE family subunit [Pseudomonadota bacterium]
MGAIGPWQIVLVLVLAVLLFGGGGRISSIMGDMAKGLKAFRSGLKEDEANADKSLEERADEAVDVTPTKDSADTSKS